MPSSPFIESLRHAIAPKNYSGYSITVAEPDSFDTVYKYCRNINYSEAFLPQSEIQIHSGLDKGNIFTAQNGQGEIIGVSILYPLAQGNRFDCILFDGVSPDKARRVISLGAALSSTTDQGDVTLNSLLRKSLYGVPMLSAFLNAEETEQPFDRLTCTINRESVNDVIVLAQLTGDAAIRKYTPFRWMLAKPTEKLKELIIKEAKISPDAPLQTYLWSSVEHLPRIAQSFASAARKFGGSETEPQYDKCVFEDDRHNRLQIDMGRLSEKLLYSIELFAEYPRTLTDNFPINISWAAARDSINSLFESPPNDPNSLRRLNMNRSPLHT